MKRILSVFLSLLMVVGAFPMTVLADELREDPVFLSVSPLPDMEYIAGTPYAGFAVEQTKLPEDTPYGQIERDNTASLELARAMGFSVSERELTILI